MSPRGVLDVETLGLVRAGDQEAHIVGSSLAGLTLSMCGKEIRLWPLVDGVSVRVCRLCRTYADGARMAGA